ncbi:MAG: geranylgeranyl reductase family protein [Promethearchaeota archaeon]
MYDVVISGAGPAGSRCAETLARAGFKVALLEKDSNWRKPCGGAVSSSIFKYYPQLKKLDLLPITGIKMYSGDYHSIEYSWKGIKHYSINVDRLEFDNFIRNLAIDAGAELFDKTLSNDFIRKEGKFVGIIARTESGIKEFHGRLLIIADGMSSKLAVKSGLREKWKPEELGLAKCALMEGKNNLPKDSIQVFFRSYKGYGWIFPLSEERFNIGCGTFAEDNFKYNLHVIFEEFIKSPHIKKYFPAKNYKTLWSGSYPLPGMGVKEKSLFSDNIMIIGDAAGFVSPISGEGIHPSIVSGQISAETAIMALENDEINKQMLKKYKTHVKIKKIIANFKIKRSMVDFFYQNGGKNLSKMFQIAEVDDDFREKVINMFLFNQAPSKEFLLKIQE